MNIKISFLCVFVIVLILSVSLLIFAPKGKNYYKNIYPHLNNISENIKIFEEDLNTIKKEEWIQYPCNIFNNVMIYPLYIFDTKVKKNIKTCIKSFNIIKTIPDIVSIYYLLLESNSKILTHKKWKSISNITFCAMIVLEVDDLFTADECFICVDGESRSLKKDEIYIFDSSREYSIVNDTDEPLYVLILDIKRPKKHKNLGISNTEYDNKTIEFIKKINKKNKTHKKEIKKK